MRDRKTRARQSAARRQGPGPSILAAVAVIALALVGVVLLLTRAEPKAQGGDGVRDNSLGLASAPVVVEDWSDFQ